jgi:hypothetical protein
VLSAFEVLAPIHINTVSKIMENEIGKIEYPTEIKELLDSISERWPEYAQMSAKGYIKLRGLSPEQNVALSFFFLATEVEEIFGNLATIISDFKKLKDQERAFGDKKPLRRYQLLFRTYLYEHARFEDMYGYLMSWCENIKLINKKDRKDMKAVFYQMNEGFIKIRNALTHGNVDWKAHCTPDIVLLQGADLFNRVIFDNEGRQVTWQGILSPLCEKMINVFTEEKDRMLNFWNNVFFVTGHFLKRHGHI